MKYVFKIKLSGLSNPEVWRTVIVPGNYTFFKFHKVIQLAFGWENLHFFKFLSTENGNCINIYMPHEDDLDDEELNFVDATLETVDNIISKGITHLTYHYDRNDNWIHDIVLLSSSEEDIQHPKCIEGGGMCPPEGCNGVHGYEHIKYILREHPDSHEARRCREWLFMEDDEEFNPNYFPESEIEEINDILSR